MGFGGLISLDIIIIPRKLFTYIPNVLPYNVQHKIHNYTSDKRKNIQDQSINTDKHSIDKKRGDSEPHYIA